MNAITSITASARDVASAVAAPRPEPVPAAAPAPTPIAPAGGGTTTPGLVQLASALGMEPSAIASALSGGTTLSDLLGSSSPPLTTVTDALAVVGLIFESSL